jgi:hypothetical protein
MKKVPCSGCGKKYDPRGLHRHVKVCPDYWKTLPNQPVVAAQPPQVAVPMFALELAENFDAIRMAFDEFAATFKRIFAPVNKK